MKLLKVITILILIIISSIPFYYSYYITNETADYCFTGSYWNGVMSSLLATVVGIGAGLPIGLWINRKIQQEAEIAKKKEDNIFAIKQKLKIYKILLPELESSIDFLNKFKNGDFAKLHFNTAKWKAVTNSGEIKWLTDLNILSKISLSYENLEITNKLVSSWLDTLISHPKLEDSGNKSLEIIRKLIIASSDDSLTEITKLISLIKNEIN